MNTSDKFFWIINHEKIGVPLSQGSIELTPQMVCPKKRKIRKDKSKNTKLEWWVEFSKLHDLEDECNTHYWDLDTGGDTAEEAIDNLYKLVLKKYGEYS